MNAVEPYCVTALASGRELVYIEANEARAVRRREALRQQGFVTFMDKVTFGSPVERLVHIDAAVFGEESPPVSQRQAQLVGIRDIAKLLQLNAGHVRDRVVKRAGFPLPVICEARVRRWRLEAIELWLRRQQDLSRRGMGVRL